MPASRSVILRLLSPPADATGRRIAIAGVAGILLTAPLSLQESVAPHPLVSWLLTCCGAVLAVICLRPSWDPRVIVARGAIIVCIVFCAVSGILGISQTVAALQRSDRQLLCNDDVAPDTVVGAQEVIHGIDPYTSFNILDAERKLGCPAYSVTPLRSGIFASLKAPPTAAQIEPAAAAAALGHPIGGLLVGFNYPAGTALLGVLGGHGLVLVSPLALLLAGLVIARRAEPSSRRVTILALGAQAGLLAVIGNARVDLLVAALLMVAVSRRRGLAMGIALGVACAVKQTAWFIAPALLVLALREGRVRNPRYQLGALLAFAAVNLPFIVAGPSAWIAGVIAPQIQPEFPLGFGPGAAGQAGSGVVAAFAILMIVAVVAGIAICAVAPRRWAPAGVIVSSLGLWIGPRSLGYYVALLGVIAVSTVIGSNLRESVSAGGLCEGEPDVRSGPAQLLHVAPDAVVVLTALALVEHAGLRLGHARRHGMAAGELVRPPVDMAVSLVARQQTERTGTLLDDLLEVRAAAAARSRRRRLALRLWPAARRRWWFCSHRPLECRTPYGASIDWIRDASSLILKGFESV